MTEKKLPRRAVLKGALLGVAAVPVSALLDRTAMAASGPVDPSEPQAQQLGYVTDASQVETRSGLLELPAGTWRQGRRCRGSVQHLRRPQSGRRGLVQGLCETPVSVRLLNRHGGAVGTTDRAVFCWGNGR
jgi:hypothetical protein